jgi:hypothetical protein
MSSDTKGGLPTAREDDIRGPWRVGGQAKLTEEVTDAHRVKANHGDWTELAMGQDLWRADNSPVFHLEDWYSDEDLALAASAPDLSRRLQIAEKALEAVINDYPKGWNGDRCTTCEHSVAECEKRSMPGTGWYCAAGIARRALTSIRSEPSGEAKP